MAERKTFTVEIYEDTGEVKEVTVPEPFKVTRSRLTEKPIDIGPINRIVIPLEIVMSATGRVVHLPDCRYVTWPTKV